MTVPSSIATYGTVTGRFVTADGDSPLDPDSFPNASAALGTVTFTPNVSHVRTRTVGLKTIMIPRPVICPVDNEGYLTSPGNPGLRAVTLIASDDAAAIQPTGWTYTVSFQLSSSIPSFAIQVLAGGAIDLADVVPTAGSALVSVPTAVSLAAEAQAAAAAAALSAAEAAASVAAGGGGGGLTAEEIRDMLATTLVAGTRMTVTANDAADTITFATTATTNDTDANLRARASHTGTQSADTLTDGTTNKAFLATERTKLTGVATAATANDTDANLRARGSHTGTQSADTLTDGTTNKAFLATERTKLTGIATAATANDTDANLKARANHTGTQAISTVTGLQTALDAMNVRYVLWTTGTGWGTVPTSTSLVRVYVSTNDAAATAPVHYTPHDLWFKKAA
jgi:hypothetical protein